MRRSLPRGLIGVGIAVGIVDVLVGTGLLAWSWWQDGTRTDFRNAGVILAIGVVCAGYFWRLHVLRVTPNARP